METDADVQVFEECADAPFLCLGECEKQLVVSHEAQNAALLYLLAQKNIAFRAVKISKKQSYDIRQ